MKDEQTPLVASALAVALALSACTPDRRQDTSSSSSHPSASPGTSGYHGGAVYVGGSRPGKPEGNGSADDGNEGNSQGDSEHASFGESGAGGDAGG